MTEVFFISLLCIIGILAMRAMEMKRGSDFLPKVQRAVENAGYVWSGRAMRATIRMMKALPGATKLLFKKIQLKYFRSMELVQQRSSRAKIGRYRGDSNNSSSAFLRQVATYRRDNNKTPS
jgi:hypothetical protein